MARNIDSRQLGIGRPSHQPSPFAARLGYGGQAAALNMQNQLRFDRQTAARAASDLFEAARSLHTALAAGGQRVTETVSAAINKPIFAASSAIVRDDKGGVIGPPVQYVASAFNHNESPFTRGTAAKVLAYFMMLYGVMKVGALNSPADLVSAIDDVGDTIVHLAKSTFEGNPELDTKYFEGFFRSVYKCSSANPADVPGETCYAAGGTYYQDVASHPEHARLWGYLDGMSPLEKDLLFWLLVTGGVGGFFYLNRRSLRDLMQGYGLPADEWKDLGVSTAKATALIGGSLAFALGVDREIAHPIATWLMLVGAATIVASEYRSPIQRIKGASDMPWGKALLAGAAWVGGEAIYRALSDSAGVYQFTPEGHSTIYGNWLSWDWGINLPLLAADLGTELALLAPLWSRAGGFVQNNVEVVLASLSRAAYRNRRGFSWLQRAIPELNDVDPATGSSLAHLQVRPRIQAFSETEKAAVRAGQMPSGIGSAAFGHVLTLGAAGFLGYEGATSLASLLTGESHHATADVILSLLGLGATGVAAGAALRDGRERLLYKQLASFLGHQFGPNGRAVFWSIYTVVATTATTGIGFTSQAIKGFEAKSGYYWNIITRSLLNPWVNRLYLGWRTAYWPEKPVSKFGFFMWGFFTVYCGIEFSAQTTQSLDMQYQAMAREYSLTTDPDQQTALLGKMSGLEALVSEAKAQDGYGRAETLERAGTSLTAIAAYKAQYGIPDISLGDRPGK